MPSYDENSVLTLAGLKTALTRAKAETLAAIAAAGHLSKKKVDAVPEAASAEENTFYFVKNNDTGHYDIYFKIDGVMELIDDTTVDMEGYVTDEALAEALNGVGGGALYKGTKKLYAVWQPDQERQRNRHPGSQGQERFGRADRDSEQAAPAGQPHPAQHQRV